MARRYAFATDANQPEIVRALRKVGALVEDTSKSGKGFPDLVVAFRGTVYLIEVKDGSKPPSKRKLTDDQVLWHEKWNGYAAIVKNIDEALNVIGATKERN